MSNADTPEVPDHTWQSPAGDPVTPASDSANPGGAPQPPYGAPDQSPYGAPDQPPYGAPAQPPYGTPGVPPVGGSVYGAPQAPSSGHDPYAAQQPYPPAPPHPAYGRPPVAPKDANPLSALFDFGFTKFATPGIVKIVYIGSMVLAALGWLSAVLSGFGAARYTGGAAMGMVALLFGWIPAVLFVAYMRFILEAVVALIRIHDRVDEIAERTKGDSAQS